MFDTDEIESIYNYLLENPIFNQEVKDWLRNDLPGLIHDPISEIFVNYRIHATLPRRYHGYGQYSEFPRIGNVLNDLSTRELAYPDENGVRVEYKTWLSIQIIANPDEDHDAAR